MKPARPRALSTVRTGARAEALALRYLESRGLRPVAANYRCRPGELDLVMLDGAVLVIVEVRYRARPDPVDPAVTITATKRRRLLRSAMRFLQDHPKFSDHAVRLDVVAVSGSLDAAHFDWIPSAFTADDVAGH